MKIKYATLVIASLITGCNTDSSTSKDNNHGQDYQAPMVSNVSVAGDPYINSTLTGIYTYIDPNYRPRGEKGSIYTWQVSGEMIGNEKTLLISDSQLGQSVSFCVTPVASGESNTTGETKCSAGITIVEGAGTKPVASDVAIDNMSPTVGDRLTGSYIYSDEDDDLEAVSLYSWKKDDILIPNENSTTLELSPNLQDGQIEFCVTPVSETKADEEHYSVIGDEVCSSVTNNALPLQGEAPQANDISVDGKHSVGNTVTGTYTYQDDDKDLEGESNFSWKRGSDIIATTLDYTFTSEDKEATITFCVTPVALTGLPTEGSETCSYPISDVSDPAGIVPTISIDTITSDNDITFPQSGDELTGSYTYNSTDNNSQDDSKAIWKFADTQINEDNCVTGQACDLTLTSELIGKDIKFCVIPKATNSIDGYEVCSDPISVVGIKISGALEFRGELVADASGYTNPIYSWKVDTSNIDGPAGDISREKKGAEQIYTIGQDVLDLITTDIDIASNNNGIVDDADWNSALLNGDIDSSAINAANYIGKDVELCVTADETNGQETCVLASEQSETDVTGGLFYEAKNTDKRAIEPTRTVTMMSSTYHRPLTVAELSPDSKSGFGDNLPKQNFTFTISGVEWSSFKLDDGVTTPAVDVCLNLYSYGDKDVDSWSLPASRADSKYIANGYEDKGNNPPAEGASLLIKFAGIAPGKTGLMGVPRDSTAQVSPTYGWPINASSGNPYWSATLSADDSTKANSVKFYDSGASGNNSVGSGRFVSCVRSAQSI